MADIGYDEYVPSQDPGGERSVPSVGPGSPDEGVGGDDPPATRRVQPPSSIQAVIDASRDGDTVVVAPGTYLETLDFCGKAITLRGEGGRDLTVRDGGGRGSVVSFRSGEGRDSKLEGFTITNGEATFGGGILCLGASPEIADNEIRGNRALLSGGGVALLQSNPLVEASRIVENEAGVFGGGIICGDCSEVEITGSQIVSNTAGRAGGGLGLTECDGIFTGNLVEGNRGAFGGGVDCCGQTTAGIRDNTLTGNEATTHYGGAIFIGNASPAITNNWILDNTAGLHGGGIHIAWDSPARLVGNVIAGNRARTGGGVCFLAVGAARDAPEVTNCTITGNRASEWGGGVYVRDARPVIDNTIVSGNEAVGGSELHLERGELHVSNTIVAGEHETEGVIALDPSFVDAATEGPCAYPFRPEIGSPCIDSGRSVERALPEVDLEGNPRIADGDGDGAAVVDIGAVELTGRR